MSFAPSPKKNGTTESSVASRTQVITVSTYSALTKKFVFASDWFFHPKGISALKTGFENELNSRDLTAKLEWNKGDATFRISCLHVTSEQVWDVFFKTVRAFIAQESGFGLDDSDDESDLGANMEDSNSEEATQTSSRKIQRLAMWKKENGIKKIVNACEDDDELSSTQQLDDDFPQSIRSHNSRFTWDYGAANPPLEDVFPDERLVKLERLVGCEFAKDLNLSRIFIGAASEEIGRRAISKLENIRKTWTLNYAYVKHLFYTEELENYQLAFKYLPDVKKKFFETTLLDNLQLSALRFNYRNLPFAATVRCFTFNPIKSRYTPAKAAKYYAAVDFDHKDAKFREWQDFTYNPCISQGKAEDNAMTRFERYTMEHQKTPQSDEVQPTEQAGIQSEPQTLEIPSIPTQNAPHGQEIQRWVLSQDKPLSSSSSMQSISEHDNSNKQEQLAPWDTVMEHLQPDRHGMRNNRSRIPDYQSNLTGSAPEQRAQVFSILPQTPQTPLSQRSASINVRETFHPLSDNSSNQSLVSTTLSTKKEVSTNILDEDNTVIAVPVLQPTPREINLLLDDAFGNLTRVVSGHISQQREAMQSVTEVASRKFYSTMNQKAPKPGQKNNTKGLKSVSLAGRLERPSPPPVRHTVPSTTPSTIDPSPHFIASMALSFDEILQGLPGFMGELKVQAEFGRMLLKAVPRKQMTQGESERSFGPEDALGLLENSDAPTLTVFTKMLTVLPADMTYLVEMKDSSGNFIWNQTHSSWDVFYEILCVDTRPSKRRPFTIEIDGEKLSCQAKTRRDFGAINVHGVKRHWDFRISATGTDAEDDTDSEYRSFAKTVRDSLHIPTGLAQPMLFFEVPDAFRHLAIFGVRVRRINRYRSIDTKSILSVSEVNELQMFDTRGDVCTIWKAVGCVAPDSPLTTQQGNQYKWFYLWHEVSISCAKADEMFEQNKSVELGEETSWNVEKLTDIHAVQSLYLPACAMLKQMDGVGFYNDNNIDVSHILGASEAQQEPPAPYFFW